MSPRNLNVIKTPKNLLLRLSNKKIRKLYNIFENNFDIQEAFVVAVSGGPDSLALAFLTKVYSIKYNLNFLGILLTFKFFRLIFGFLDNRLISFWILFFNPINHFTSLIFFSNLHH